MHFVYWTDQSGQNNRWLDVLIGQGALSIMWSIHREAAVQLISLDKEKQTLVQCWRAHPTHHPLQHHIIYLRLLKNKENGDNLHEMSNPVFWERQEKYFNMSSAENFSQSAKHYNSFFFFSSTKK